MPPVLNDYISGITALTAARTKAPAKLILTFPSGVNASILHLSGCNER